MHGSSFDCSAQSILSAMNRFVGSVQAMQQTVLVPSRLRDLAPETSSPNGTQLPAALLNLDPYDLFAMLGDVRNELLWGASTGQSTVATMDSTTAVANAAAADVAKAQANASHPPLMKCQSSASLLNRSVATSGRTVSSVGNRVHPHHLANHGKALSNGNLSKEMLNASLMASRARLGQAMLSSDDGFGSLDSTASSTDSLSESGESDCDSVLEGSLAISTNMLAKHDEQDASSVVATRCRLPHRALLLSSSGSSAPCSSPLPQTQHCNSSHLATAFKYHLQGLHTILQQLSDSADFLVDQYHQEVMQASS